MNGAAHDLTLQFAYNPAGQIKSNARSNDIYAWTGHGNGTTASASNGLNQITTSGGVARTYDGRGNLLTKNGAAHAYTSENRPATLTRPGMAAYLTYDSAGRLLQTAFNGDYLRYDHLGGQIITELDGSHIVQNRYVWGAGPDELLLWYAGAGAGQRRWPHADERGSIVAITDDNGDLIHANRYDEYGKPAVTNVGRFQYTGQAWFPELDLSYYKARMYDPDMGRFLQTDPIGYGDGLNIYAYVGNDPINLVDPSGLCPESTEAHIYVCGRRSEPRPNGNSNPFATFGGFPNQGTSGPRTFYGGERLGPGTREPKPQNRQPCGQSPDSTLNIVRGGLEWLSLGADGLSIAATATGVGAPIGGLVKGIQIGLEVGLAGINLYDAGQNGNFAPALSQGAGRVAVALIPGARIGNRLRSSAALNWGTHANGRLRSGFQHKIAAQSQTIDTATGQATGSVSQAAVCVVQ